MKCSCIKGDSWHPILTALDTHTLVYDDNSDWNTDPPYKKPNKHKVTIETPSGDSFVLEVNAKGRTYITPQDLGFKKCLKDGVYCIQAYSCYNCDTDKWGDRLFTKNVLIAPQLDCKVKKAMVNSEDKGLELFAKKLELESNASLGRMNEVRTLYSDLEDEVSNFECSNCC